jgi:hypothetical protein
MTVTLLPQLAAESFETAERLLRLSAEEGVEVAEAEYILESGLEALQRLPHLWPIVKKRIGAGMLGATAHDILTRLLDAVDKNLALAEKLKEPARVLGQQPERQLDLAAERDAAEARLLTVRAEAKRLLAVVDAPQRWPNEQTLQEATERMQRGERLTAEEFRRALLDE